MSVRCLCFMLGSLTGATEQRGGYQPVVFSLQKRILECLYVTLVDDTYYAFQKSKSHSLVNGILFYKLEMGCNQKFLDQSKLKHLCFTIRTTTTTTVTATQSRHQYRGESDTKTNSRDQRKALTANKPKTVSPNSRVMNKTLPLRYMMNLHAQKSTTTNVALLATPSAPTYFLSLIDGILTNREVYRVKCCS